MLGSITPLGERGRNRRWGITVTTYVIGSALGGVAIAAALGGLGAAIGLGDLSVAARLGTLAAMVILGLAFDLHLGGSHLPSVRRQVNEEWMVRYRSWVYGLGFGVQLGLGVVTIVTTSAIYAMLLAATLSGSAATGALIGGVFGFVRAAIVFTVAGVQRPEQLGKADVLLRRWDGWTRRAAVGVSGALSVALTVGAVR
ncbi:MAG: hypothetical protein ABI572_08810 [Actinomycetota bacterium]